MCIRAGGGGGAATPADSPLIEIELGERKKNEACCSHQTKRLVHELKILGQPVTSAVG